MPFDRLIGALDAWAAAHPNIEFFAQVGETARPPAHMPFARSLSPAAFVAKVRAAQLVVAHAGMGSILTALEHARPILVMPRRGDLRETRNDHQVATARRFAASSRVLVAMDESELAARLDALVAGAGAAAPATPPIGSFASTELIGVLRRFVLGAAGERVPGESGARSEAGA